MALIAFHLAKISSYLKLDNFDRQFINNIIIMGMLNIWYVDKLTMAKLTIVNVDLKVTKLHSASRKGYKQVKDFI